MFRGALQSRLTCQQCGHESVKSESFLDLSLSLSQASVNEGPAAPGPYSPMPEDPTSTVSSIEAMEVEVQSPIATLQVKGEEIENSAGAAPVPVEATPAKRGRGRPARAKNIVRPTPAAALETATVSASDAASAIALSEVGRADRALVEEAGGELSSEESDAPHISLSDCMRAFTATETLGEKIVSNIDLPNRYIFISHV